MKNSTVLLKRLKAAIYLALALGILMLLMKNAQAAPLSSGLERYKKDYHVLFISSYTESYGNVPKQVQGMKDVFYDSDVELDIEYMDAKRFPGIGYLSSFKELIEFKINKSYAYDCIITGDDDALQFVMDNQKELFHGIPVLYMGVDSRERVMRAEQNSFITGIPEESRYYENIRLAKQLNPKLNKIYALTDESRTGLANRSKLQEAADLFKDINLEILDTETMTLDRLAQYMERMDLERDVIFFLNMSRGKDKVTLDMSEQFKVLKEYGKVPIYRCLPEGVGEGIFGGYVFSFEECGQRIAKAALAILNGKDVKELFISDSSLYHYVFDENLVYHFNIDKRLFPANTIFVNGSQPLSGVARIYLMVSVSVVIVLIIIIISMSFVLHFRRQAAVEMEKSHNKLAESERNLQRQYKQAEYIADHDNLTGLWNRRKFTDNLTSELTYGRSGAVMIYDVDDFKGINDTLGHNYGDELIRQMGIRLREIPNENVKIGRFAGDEFIVMVLCEKENYRVIDDYYKIIKEKLEKSYIINGVNSQVHFSTGVTLFPKDGNQTTDLISNVDLALYNIKRNGKNGVLYFDEKMRDTVKNRINMEKTLQKAIANDGFCLFYQPQVDCKTGVIVGFEALLRLKDKFISPAQFIPIAEETGMIVPIGRKVAEIAIKQLAEWKAMGLDDKHVSINYSVNQIKDTGYTDYVSSLIREYQVDPALLEIEITESVMLEENDFTRSFMNGLKDIGFSLALDDFGTGYSSLSYLTYMPVTVMKLDKTVNDRFLNSDTPEVLKALIQLAHSLNLKVVGEGIEDWEGFKKMNEFKCDYIQGYLFSKPLISEEATKIHDFVFEIKA
ncbi:MAG: EAL domain-containing protein [Lachnospiraceae bacterium]|nr:EAL domain-containing protein [Lachnospiraceae bacterium]